jgi:hypothetical protein
MEETATPTATATVTATPTATEGVSTSVGVRNVANQLLAEGGNPFFPLRRKGTVDLGAGVGAGTLRYVRAELYEVGGFAGLLFLI